MSNMFIFRKKHTQQEIRKNAAKLAGNIVIAAVLLAIIIYLVYQYILKPNLYIDEAVISISGSADPVPEDMTRIGEQLVGLSFRDAVPEAVEAAFTAWGEIERAEVTRYWNGRLEAVLYPRSAVSLVRSSSSGAFAAVDEYGVIFGAAPWYCEFLGESVPLIEADIESLLLQGGGLDTAGLLGGARLMRTLQKEEPAAFALITRVKYDNNSNRMTAVLNLDSGTGETVFEFGSTVSGVLLGTTITAAADAARQAAGQMSFSSVEVYEDSAVMRL